MRSNFLFIFGFIAVCWGVFLLDFCLDLGLKQYGLLPRTKVGLLGIFTSPFLHVSQLHLMHNTVPVLVLGSLICIQRRNLIYQVSAMVILLGGSLVWLLGRHGIHQGASGLVYGFFGFLIGHAWYSRRVLPIALAILTMILYGGLLQGVLPSRLISWEGHLFNLLAGLLAARLNSGPTIQGDR